MVVGEGVSAAVGRRLLPGSSPPSPSRGLLFCSKRVNIKHTSIQNEDLLGIQVMACCAFQHLPSSA